MSTPLGARGPLPYSRERGRGVGGALPAHSVPYMYSIHMYTIHVQYTCIYYTYISLLRVVHVYYTSILTVAYYTVQYACTHAITLFNTRCPMLGQNTYYSHSSISHSSISRYSITVECEELFCKTSKTFKNYKALIVYVRSIGYIFLN